MIIVAAVQLAVFALAAVAARRAALRDAALDVANALRRAPALALVTIVCGAALVASIAAEISDAVCRLHPLWVQRWVSLITWLLVAAIFSLISAYAVVLAAMRRHAKRRELGLAAALIHIAVATMSWQLLSPADLGDSPIVRDGVILQTSDATCAAATFANLATLRGGRSLTETEAAEILGTTHFGTSPGQMRYALTRLAIAYHTLDGDAGDLEAIAAPAILFVDHPAVGREGHAVLYVGQRSAVRAEPGDPASYEILDPLEGRVLWGAADATSRWHGSGIRILP